ncbi:hypothetical protein [Nitrosovibrio sp. Nv6]|uniref:hypothetical protein n=1 Tax=Nitrosovibrio sp. Nv6 TaxID=1855340 RepID=UPI0008B0F3DB|nr:hypothetical protein [Nitrosovibrio sp. Nv6]SEO64715.1 hypothetical protein SAMN05216316_0702 [Nitrosovibrio sp. Nv6]
MVEVAKPKKPVWAEIRDQVAHVIAAILLMYLFVRFPLLALAAVVMIIALIRELRQHEWRDFGKLDMTFWGVGCLLFLVAYYTPISIIFRY